MMEMVTSDVNSPLGLMLGSSRVGIYDVEMARPEHVSFQ